MMRCSNKPMLKNVSTPGFGVIAQTWDSLIPGIVNGGTHWVIPGWERATTQISMGFPSTGIPPPSPCLPERGSGWVTSGVLPDLWWEKEYWHPCREMLSTQKYPILPQGEAMASSRLSPSFRIVQRCGIPLGVTKDFFFFFLSCMRTDGNGYDQCEQSWLLYLRKTKAWAQNSTVNICREKNPIRWGPLCQGKAEGIVSLTQENDSL